MTHPDASHPDASHPDASHPDDSRPDDSRPGAAATLADALEVLSALQDPVRLRLLVAVLGGGPERRRSCTLAEAAAATGLAPREVLETAGRMGASGVLRLDGSTLTADLTAVQRAAQAVEDAVPVTALLDGHPQLARRFRRGRLVRVPERWAEQAELAGVLVGLLPAGTELAEVEVNRVLGEVGEPATLRRLLVDHGALERDPAALVYRRREG